MITAPETRMADPPVVLTAHPLQRAGAFALPRWRDRGILS